MCHSPGYEFDIYSCAKIGQHPLFAKSHDHVPVTQLCITNCANNLVKYLNCLANLLPNLNYSFTIISKEGPSSSVARAQDS